MRGTRALLTAALAWRAAACGNHGHDGHEWTAEELAELEHKWGMEVRLSVRASLFCGGEVVFDEGGGFWVIGEGRNGTTRLPVGGIFEAFGVCPIRCLTRPSGETPLTADVVTCA